MQVAKKIGIDLSKITLEQVQEQKDVPSLQKASVASSKVKLQK